MTGKSDNVILTDVGRSYLKRKLLAGEKGIMSYFQTGDDNLFTPSVNDVDIHGTQTYNGFANEDMAWIQYSEDELIIRCFIESDKGNFFIGNIGIFAETTELLFITAFPYRHFKMKSTEDQVGGRWTYQIRLNIKDILEVFDQSNMPTKYATMTNTVLTHAPQHPFDSYYTELALDDTFLPTNRSAYVCLSTDVSRKWSTMPFQLLMSYVEVQSLYELDGGEVNDLHRGVWG